MTWHNAFVFTEDGFVDVYEIYHLGDEVLCSEDPVMTLYGENPEDLLRGLGQLLVDLQKGRYFESAQKMHQHYGMGGDDIE